MALDACIGTYLDTQARTHERRAAVSELLSSLDCCLATLTNGTDACQTILFQ